MSATNEKNSHGTTIYISNSPIGLFNTGELSSRQSIHVSLSTLTQTDYGEVAEAIKHITQAVTHSQDLTNEKRTEILDLLDVLRTQATLPKEKRSTTAALKAIATGVASSMGAAGGLAEVWNTWGVAIKTFFGF